MTSGAIPQVIMRRAAPADAVALAAMASTAFTDTFGAHNDPRDMADYLAKSFGESVQRAELADPGSTVWLAEHEGEPAGYAMLRDGPPPECVSVHDAIEIARLYVVKRFIGAGIGALLMRRCIEEASARGNDAIWLGVWEHNVRAIAFYERWEFVDVGSLAFMLGRDRQTDRVMVRRMRPAAE